MPTTRQIRSRIRTAKNIQQITKAMKMVAAARLKRAQDRVQSARPYTKAMYEMMESLSGIAGENVSHPLLQKREVQNTGVLIITADRGLSGSYNSQSIRKASEVVGRFDKSRVKLFMVGRKGDAFFRRRGYNVVQTLGVTANNVQLSEAAAITAAVRDAFEAGEIDELYLVYTVFKSAMTQKPESIQILPIAQQNTDNPNPASSDFIFEPDPQTLLGELLPRYLLTVIYQALLESIASEHGSRMTAMSSATDNAGKMISNLTLVLNRARQAGITKEISEIVGGAEALKG